MSSPKIRVPSKVKIPNTIVIYCDGSFWKSYGEPFDESIGAWAANIYMRNVEGVCSNFVLTGIVESPDSSTHVELDAIRSVLTALPKETKPTIIHHTDISLTNELLNLWHSNEWVSSGGNEYKYTELRKDIYGLVQDNKIKIVRQFRSSVFFNKAHKEANRLMRVQKRNLMQKLKNKK